MNVSILTPTGDRPEALGLLAGYLGRQTWQGRLQWIVVDDGREPRRPEAPANVDLTYVRREEPRSRATSLQRNLIVGLRHVSGDVVLICEDDDWYAANYVETLAEFLERHQLVGEGRARYYNVRERRFRMIGNRRHASLCQTAFRREMVPFVDHCIRATRGDFVDLTIWRTEKDPTTGRGVDRHLFFAHGLCVGIKGMPGRNGIGIGHRPSRGFDDDPDLHVLRGWVGRDVELYRGFAGPAPLSWWEWARRERINLDRWIVLGKGPSFAQRDAIPDDARTLGLNHVCREHAVDVTHIIDIDVVTELGAALAERSGVVVMPWHPHVNSSCHRTTLPQHVAKLPALRQLAAAGRLLYYHALSGERFKTRPNREPVVGVKFFSVEAACNLLLGSRVRRILTLGVDGGNSYSGEFSDIPAMRNGRRSFDVQFGELRKMQTANAARIESLAPRGRLKRELLRRPVAFVHVPKCAGSSIGTALRGVLGEGHKYYASERHRPEPHLGFETTSRRSPPGELPALVCGHMPASRMLQLYPGARLLTCVRDPVDRLRSLYDFWLKLGRDARVTDPRCAEFLGQRKRAGGMPLAEFATLYGNDLCLQSHLDVPPERFASIIRFETLAEQWPAALQALGIPACTLGRLNALGDVERTEFDADDLAETAVLLTDEIRVFRAFGGAAERV